VHTLAHLCTYSNTFGLTRKSETHGSQHTLTPVHIPTQLCTYSRTFAHTRTPVHTPAHLYVHRCVSMLRTARFRCASMSKSVRVCTQVCGCVHWCASVCGFRCASMSKSFRVCATAQLYTYPHTLGYTRTPVHILTYLKGAALKRDAPPTTYK